jgi:hypothetical protein
MEKMKVQVKFVWGKVGRGEKVLLLLLPLATKQWNLPLATELGSSFASFHFFLLKMTNLDHLEFSSKHNF